jgi:ATP-dependent helicase HepA
MSLQSPFVPGQRWISTAEPELGLATVLRVEPRSVQLLFAATATIRQYALASAPLLRAEFKPGDRITGHGGRALRVERVEQSGGLITYHGEGSTFHEGELDDMQAVSKADDRLISGRVDANARFEFRLQTLARRARARSADTFGYSGARVELIEHQLRVAEIAASRNPVRVLLADEVGLGKTIEAGLILARMIATGRAQRVLVLVPEALMYQWFVELLRRFNLRFSIFDAERADSIEQSDESRNPFQDDQFILTDLGFLTGSSKRARQIAAAGWDLMVVDEAHHLAWTPQEASPEYALAEQLAIQTPERGAADRHAGAAGPQRPFRAPAPARSRTLQRPGNLPGRVPALCGSVTAGRPPARW